jgi:5'-3' exonuclease
MEGLLDQSGRPVWALKGLIGYLARAAAQLRPNGVIVGFDCPDSSARRSDYPGYKAQRAQKPADLDEQLRCAPELLRAAGICTVVPPAFEADDVLASSAEQARRGGWRSVLMTSDRDAFALIDASTSVLRVRNGGFDEAVLVDAESLRAVCGVEPWQYRDYAALRGDPSDNLHGVRQFGAARASRLLAAFGTVEAAWTALDRGDERAISEVVGDVATQQLGLPAMREIVDRNRRLMSMRADLHLPSLDAARLPLDLATMRRALSARGINLSRSLWALTHADAPSYVEKRPLELKPWVYRRGLRSRREPIPGQLTLF